MATGPTNRQRRSNLLHDSQPRQSLDDNTRKSPNRDGNTPKFADYCSAGDERIGRRFEMNSKSLCNRQGDTGSEYDLCKLSEAKTSDEGSATEVDIEENGHGDVRPTCNRCEFCPKKYDNLSREYSGCPYGKCSAQRPKSGNVGENGAGMEGSSMYQAGMAPNRNQRFRNYTGNPINFPQAMIAFKKLERLKELQRRRENSERYYSQEIRRLIGESFFENTAIVPAPAKNKDRTSSPGTRANEEPQPATDQRNRGGGYTKDLEPSGTMTTITRFNCGCMEETTIPIFNTSVGLVKKCESHRYQERSKGGAYSQESAYRAAELHQNSTRSRGKSANLIPRDLESWEGGKYERSRRSPRNSSPMRPISPTPISDESSN